MIRSIGRVLSAFSGAGGLDLGMECAGFDTVACFEIAPSARETLRRNRPRWHLVAPGDLGALESAFDARALGFRPGELTGLVGGPPCQPFSKAAQWVPTGKRGISDPRMRCLGGFFKLIDALLPRFLLIENVQGFVSGRGNALGLVAGALRRINARNGCGYSLQHWIVDAADYGVPQRRKRAIIFAERTGQVLSLPQTTHGDRPITAWDALHDVRCDPAGTQAKPLRGWQKLLPSIPEGCNYLWHTPRGEGQPLFSYRSRYWSFLLKLSKTKPAWTLPAQPGPYVGPFHWENRSLTPREMARLQSFPDEWQFAGSAKEQVRQIGNATPPLLAEVIGRQIAVEIFGRQTLRPLRLTINRATTLPTAPTFHRRIPREFIGLRREWPDHPGTGRGPNPVSQAQELNVKA